MSFMYSDQNGKSTVTNRFLPMAEAKMWNELYTSIEAQLVYGKKHTSTATSGYWKKTGQLGHLVAKSTLITFFNCWDLLLESRYQSVTILD